MSENKNKKHTDVLIIGGSAGGLLSATTIRKVYPEKSVIVVRKTETVMVPCGIPYIFGTLNDTAKNRIPDAMLTGAGVSLLVDEVISVNLEEKVAVLKDNQDIFFDKLVVATGSLPVIPKMIRGYDLKNVFPIYKDEKYLATILDSLKEKEDIVVIGGGFIGVEFAEQLKLLGKNVTIIEAAEKCLWQAFDKAYCEKAEGELESLGIRVISGEKVLAIGGTEHCESVTIGSGEVIKADLVILGIGVIPNTELVQKAGIAVNGKDAILVDNYQRTSHKDVVAVGDCTEKRCSFMGDNAPILLASTAAMEAKVAAANLYGIKFMRENQGVISAFSTKVGSKTFGAVGFNLRKAEENGFEVVVGYCSTMDKHPASLLGTKAIELTLIFAKQSGILLGAQVIGGDSVGELINVLSLAVQRGVTANELNSLQVATHPLLTASPIAYAINVAAFDALLKK